MVGPFFTEISDLSWKMALKSNPIRWKVFDILQPYLKVQDKLNSPCSFLTSNEADAVKTKNIAMIQAKKVFFDIQFPAERTSIS